MAFNSISNGHSAYRMPRSSQRPASRPGNNVRPVPRPRSARMFHHGSIEGRVSAKNPHNEVDPAAHIINVAEVPTIPMLIESTRLLPGKSKKSSKSHSSPSPHPSSGTNVAIPRRTGRISHGPDSPRRRGVYLGGGVNLSALAKQYGSASDAESKARRHNSTATSASDDSNEDFYIMDPHIVDADGNAWSSRPLRTMSPLKTPRRLTRRPITCRQRLREASERIFERAMNLAWSMSVHLENVKSKEYRDAIKSHTKRRDGRK